ncbi:MAG: hypothetical protein M3Z66_10760 [Chloroflexota bacterium]|nr:hypothetical protein [Chloroflexota bacterium]
MAWIKVGVGAIVILVGLVWIGQGLNLIGGSMMTGHPIYALLGLIAESIGVWLLWTARRAAAAAQTR